MRFVFQCRYDVVESFDVGGCHAPDDVPFQIGQVAADAASQLSALCCQPNQKSAPINFPNFPRDQSPARKTIENTGQCRSLVGEAAMEIGHVRGRMMREERQNVRFSLSQSGFLQSIKVKADPVRCPVNWMNKVQWH
jgi:hypothetical protein